MSAFQANAFQNNAFQTTELACIPAFNPSAFQNNAFQVCPGGPVCTPAFNPNAFQKNAFQVCEDEPQPRRGGGWYERPQAEKARREADRKRREAWKRLEQDIEEAYADATGQPRKKVKPIVREALAARDPETVRRIAERLSVSTDPAATALMARIDERVSEIEQFARLIAEIERDMAIARMRDEEEAIVLLMMAG